MKMPAQNVNFRENFKEQLAFALMDSSLILIKNAKAAIIHAKLAQRKLFF